MIKKHIIDFEKIQKVLFQNCAKNTVTNKIGSTAWDF